MRDPRPDLPRLATRSESATKACQTKLRRGKALVLRVATADTCRGCAEPLAILAVSEIGLQRFAAGHSSGSPLARRFELPAQPHLRNRQIALHRRPGEP